MSSFGFIWAHLTSFHLMHYWQKCHLDWTAFGRRILLWKEGGLFNKSWGFLGEVGLLPPRRGTTLFSWLVLSASTQFVFTHIKWNNRQMGFTNVRSDNILRSNNHRYSYKIENLHEPCVTFSGIKGKNYDSSTLVYICVYLSSDSSTLLYIRLWFVYISLHSSSDASVFLK